MQYFTRWVASCAVVLVTLVVGCAYGAAQETQYPSAIHLTFPLKATVPDQDQHLTSATAPVNSTFDHSMLDATTHYVVYGCDKTVVAFTGTTAPYGPGYPILGIGCNAGYKVQNVQFPPPIDLAPDMSYSGWGSPGYLFYDGLPGIDYVAAMDTQVYAAANGTVHYPTRIFGLGYPAAAYHVLEIVPDHGGPIPPYVIYYLHLDTYVGQNKIPVADPDPLPGCSGIVYLPLDEGTHVQAGCLITLSGRAAPPIFHYLPHLHFEVHQVVPGLQVFSRFGARTADVCIDGVVGPAYDCVPVDPYGWTGDATKCDPVTGLADSGDPYYCLTGVTSAELWK
jgi:murein DD-endopeptidase MepM/ murein hydrolase activator NlpD